MELAGEDVCGGVSPDVCKFRFTFVFFGSAHQCSPETATKLVSESPVNLEI